MFTSKRKPASMERV